MLLVHLEGDVDLLAGELDLRDRADLDAGDAHRRPDAQPGDVREPRLQVSSAARRSPWLPVSVKIVHRGDDERHDRQHADLQFRPGERACSRHMLVLET